MTLRKAARKDQAAGRPLRVAQIHWAFPPTIGGVETHLTVLMPELAKTGHTVFLLTEAMRDLPEFTNFEGIDVQRSPYLSLDYLLTHDPELLQEEIRATLQKFLERVKPDVIHAHNLHYFSYVHAQTLSALARKKGIPLLLTAHNAWDDILFLQLSRDVPWDHIIAVSHFIKRELMGVGCEEGKITVIHHGIDVAKFHPRINPAPMLRRFPQLRGRRVVFHPARMGLAKGSDVAVKAFRLVQEKFSDAVLVLAGAGNIVDWAQSQEKDIAYILNLIKYFGLKKNVLIDTFHLEEMPAMYATCQVAIYPSSAPEPFGLTMLEAVASGRPMIVTNMGGMPEVIRDNICGYVIPVRDHESLAARIIHLLSHDQVRMRMGETGRALAMDHFSHTLMTRQHAELYRRLLAGAKAR